MFMPTSLYCKVLSMIKLQVAPGRGEEGQDSLALSPSAFMQ